MLTSDVSFPRFLPSLLQGRQIQNKILQYLHKKLLSLHIPRETSGVLCLFRPVLYEFKTLCLVVGQSCLKEDRVDSELSI